MSEPLEITFLGTGTSHGVPMIGCDCRVCRSNDPHDKRNRTSVAVQLPHDSPAGGRVILIDVPPEFRLSAVAFGLARVDAVLLTHAHADHIMGADDLRRYNNILDGSIDVYGSAKSIAILRQAFGYAEGPYTHPDRPSLTMHAIEPPGPHTICDLPVTPVPLVHGRVAAMGYRIGRFAYCTDCMKIPDSSMELLAGLDVLVLDALRYTPHPAHFNLPQALEVIERLKPRRAILTHIAHEILHSQTSAELPLGVELAVDGLRVRARAE